MSPANRIRIISDCQVAMLDAGWKAIACRVLSGNDWLWHVVAQRAEHRIFSVARTQPLAWMGALQQAEFVDDERLALPEPIRHSADQ